MTKTLIEKCTSAGRYTGQRFPRCNNGKPCKACLLKYAVVQAGVEIHTAHSAPQTKCACGYDERIAGAFDQIAANINRNKKVPNTGEYLKALGHTSIFANMIEQILADPQKVYIVMADAVRYGVATGRLMEELERLEEMVGYKEGK
jgi:hypothetical protein